MTSLPSLPTTGPITAEPASHASPTADLRQVSIDLEASFLAEMLKHAGLGTPRGTFGGGAGEDQFASLLRMEQARRLAESGGIGLAESIFSSLVARARSADTDGGGQP